ARLDTARERGRTGSLDAPEQRGVRLEAELTGDARQPPRLGDGAFELESAARRCPVRLDGGAGVEALGQVQGKVQGDDSRRRRRRARVEDDLDAAGGEIAKSLDIAAHPGAPALALENRHETRQRELALGKAQRPRCLATLAE